ncbi:MAG TPA: acyl-CoA dehydrogenase [Allosphingosinicella sp.]|nr:acyl-CoA dehydrogenase [Allosphingosinicella sp.]
MTISLSEEERGLLIKSLRRLLEASWPADRALALTDDPNALRRLSAELRELGLTELGAEDGPGLRETLMVFEELGRASCPAPLIGACIANRLLAGADDAGAQSFLAAIRAGDAIPAVALAGFDGDHAAGNISFVGGQVSGSTAFVEGAAAATHLVVLVSSPPGVAVVALDDPGVRVTPTPGMAVPPLSNVELACRAGVWQPQVAEPLTDAAHVVRLASAARALGAAQRAFDLALDHAKVRKQFGHVIGEFQAIQHKLADCLSRLDATRLSLAGAADAADQADPNWRFFGEAAIAFAGPALRQLLLEVHHTLGAIGYAEEHETPRHFRSVHADLVRFGGTARARAAVADYLLAPPLRQTTTLSNLPSHDTDEQVVRFRRRVHEWLAENWTDADREANHRLPFKNRKRDTEFSRKLGAAGWIGLDWPKEFGGQEQSAGEQLAFIEEMEFAEAPIDAHLAGETIVGLAIMRYGSDEQKRDFLPAFLRGERSFALHYSEPEAGSDLPSLRTAARRDGDEWVISGQKIWTTSGDVSEYAILAARTDPEARPKHAGISVFLVPLDTPGITIRPGMFMYGRTFCETFYDDVRLPAGALLGPENGGWKVITDALAAERVMIGTTVAHLQLVFDRLIDYLRSSGDSAGAPRLDPVIRDRIGRLAAEIEVARQFTLRNANLVQAGRVPIYEAAMSKVFVGELQERLGEAGLDILGSGGLLSEESPSAPIGQMEQELRYSLMGVIGGGTSEMQRNTVAIRGLGLPRYSS